MKVKSHFLLFVLIGGFSSVVNFVARILINRVTNYEAAIIIAFPVALTTAFLLNRAFVFQPADHAWRGQFLRFLLVNLAALVQVFIVSEMFARLIFPSAGMRFHPETVAHGIGLLSPILTSYWAHKHFTFPTAQIAGTPIEVPR